MDPIDSQKGNDLLRQLEDCYFTYFRGICRTPERIGLMARDSLSRERSQRQLSLVESVTGESLKDKDVLEVGAGVGMTIATAHVDYGARAIGLEPGDDEYSNSLEIGRQVLELHGLSRDLLIGGTGEAMPFPDASFDFVISSNVIEHVDNPAAVCAETLRVLRPGGWFQFVIPNYGSWWEGHYDILWIPHLPKWLAKVYVRLLGRDPNFLDTLQLITKGEMERIFRRLESQAEIMDWGNGLWEERVRAAAVPKCAGLSSLQRILKIIHSLRLVEPLLAVGRALSWETPLVITGRRKEVT